MDGAFTRRDIGYTIISRFEEALRSFLASELSNCFSNYRDGIPSGILEKARERSANDDWNDPFDFLEDTDFPDLSEIACFRDMYPKYFSGGEIPKDEFKDLMEELYNLRCKIAHVKGYFTSLDLDKLIDCARRITAFIGTDGERFRNFVRDLEENPNNFVIPMPLGFGQDDPVKTAIPNNVPTPDYEYEGGFVGRDEDIKKLMSLLEGDLHRVITVSGAGGVGKTALALRIIQKILRAPTGKFDGVVWLSAKETKLSYLGIEDIEPTVKNYEELLDTIYVVMGFGTPADSIEQKEIDIQTIIDMYNRILIVIDNLETITDERILNFILDAPQKSKILITSRRGLGQVERRYELKQLKEKEAIYLFRQISKDKKLDDLSKLDEETVKRYVKKVSYYPLAIKWVLGQVALGKEINKVVDSINETTSDISHFCFSQIYNELSQVAKEILCALSCFDDSPSRGVLKYVVDADQTVFEDGIQELILVSLVIPEQYKNEQGEIASRDTLLSLTRGYVREQLDRDPQLKRNIEERWRIVQNTIEEAERAKRQYRFSLANLGAITEEEKVASMMAQTAFQKYQAGRYIEATEDYKRACEIAPRFASLYRNWAVMESQEGHSIEADKLLEKAAKLNPNDTQIWLTWGNIKRRADKIKEALEYYEKAYSLSPDDDIVLNALGQVKKRLGEYEEADKLFALALQKQPVGPYIKHEIINLTSLADNLVNWAESLRRERNFIEAENKLQEALNLCERAVNLDQSDAKSLDLLRTILIRLGNFYKNSQPTVAVTYFERAIMDRPIRFREAKDTIIASLEAAKIYYQMGAIDKVKKILAPKLLRIELRGEPGLQAEFLAFWRQIYPDPQKESNVRVM